MSDGTEGLIPHIRRDDDIYLVSFPKSGNTWLSFIIANMMVEKLELGFRVNHFNLHGFTPDIHQARTYPQTSATFRSSVLSRVMRVFTRTIKTSSIWFATRAVSWCPITSF